MGRYVATAIITKMTISRETSTWWCYRNQQFKDDADFIKAKEKILEELGHYLNLDLFDINSNNDSIVLYLKEEVVQEYLFDLIKEFSNYILHKSSLVMLEDFNIPEEEFFSSDKFDKNQYKLSLERDDCAENNREKNIIYCNDNPSYKIYSFYDYYGLTLFPNTFKYLSPENRDIEINCKGSILWRDMDKYAGEDETAMLKLLNLLSKKAIKNPLGNALLYYIEG